MILPRDTSLSSGGEHDIAANSLCRLWWQERRWRENLYHQSWGAPHHVPLCLLWLFFFRNKAHPPCSFEDTDFCHCSGPLSPDRRGGHQRGDTLLWCE